MDNVSTFLEDAISIFSKDRAEKRAADLERRRLDATVERERLRLASNQAENIFNPAPGNLSDKPRRDDANQRGPMRFFESMEAKWLIPIIIIILGLLFIPLGKKR